MTGLKIKGGHNIRAPCREAFVLKGATGIGNPNCLPERFRDVLFAGWLLFRRHSTGR